MTKWLVGVALALFLGSPAAAQTWYSEYNNAGTSFANGYALQPPSVQHGGARSVAHYRLDTTATTDSNTLDVTLCKEVIVTVYQSDYADGVPGSFYVMKTPDAAKSVSFKVLADITGDGVINASDDRPLTGDDGSDVDNDSTAEQAGTMYGITGANFLWVDPSVAPGASDYAYVEVSCR